MVRYGTARLPDGLRVYAIGDVHGEITQLKALHAAIEADLDAHPVADWRVVHLGDLIDRGPDSAGVLALLARLDPGRFLCVCGNHDAYLRNFFADPNDPKFTNWQTYGGQETLRSFGLDRALIREGERREIHDALVAAMPADTLDYLNGLPDQLRFGDFGFAHAGVRPGISWEAQERADLRWIRHAFLDHAGLHDVFVVHGHTPASRIDLRPNRVNVDTGAAKGGPLSCAVIEGAEIMALDGPRRVTLTPPG
ncbi:MAG: metallophosphoesterase [Pseudomonadota bacterium]